MLDRPVALIVGTISEPLHKTIEQLSLDGFHVVLCSGEHRPLKESRFLSIFSTCSHSMGDLSAAVIRTAEEFGRIDWLFYCYSPALERSLILDMDDREWDTTVSDCLKAAFLTCKCALPYIMASQDPRFILLTSEKTGDNLSARVCKAGLDALLIGMDEELAPLGVSVEKLFYSADHTTLKSLIKGSSLF